MADQPTNFSILIYANEDYSNVFKRVNILYTAGQAYHFELQDKNIKLEYGQSYTLNCSFKPSNVSIKNLNIEVVSQSNENGVLKIEKDGTLLAIGGGQCKLKVLVVLYDGTISEQYCDVVVERRPENIEINLDLQQKDGQFITSKSSLSLVGVVYPLDSKNKNITWVVDDKNIAVVVNNVLIFNQAGVVTLTASCEGVSKSVEIFYTGSYPISAEVGVREDGNIISIPQTIYVGDSFEVVLKSIFPNDTTNVNISLRVTNQITSSANGKVISVDGNCFTAVNGGSAKLIINISSSLQISYEITVIRIPERIEVDIANGKTTKQTVQLQTSVFPIDTTNKNVKFFIVNNSEIAKIEGNELIFSENGKVTIKAVCEANPNVFIEFTVEKIEKEPILIPYNSTSSSLTLGDLACFDINDFNLNYDHFEIEILEQLTQEEWENVVEINDDIIKVVGLGKATVKLVFMKEMQVVESYVHVINAVQYVEDIVFESGLDRYGDDYVTALEVLNLNFSVLPNNANNKELKFEIEESYSSVGISESIAYLNNGKIFFIKSGTILLKVTSQDFGGFSKSFRIRYTGGYAIDAELSVNSEIYLSIGQTITIDVEKWIPKDVINTLILIKEIGHTSGIQIIEIDNVTKTITALNGGVSQIVVELSNGIVKEITINVLKTVTDIKIEKEEYLISGNSLTINATAVPNTATNKVLKYELLETDIATISGNTITFIKAGTVYVKISSTDGSNVSKTIKITSTLGYIEEIVLNTKETTINKGNKFILYMLSCMPNDATFKDVFYKIISSKAIDGSNNDVIQLGENGEIIGLYGGEAIVRVYCFDYYGNEVYSDCKITVRTAVDSVDVSFDENIDNYLNKSTFITSKNQLTFNKVVFPTDAWCKDFVYEVSNLEIAEVVGNKIVFKQKGSVVIKFISKDDSMGEKSKTYTFIYTGGDLVEIEIDKTNIENDRIIINAGENFAFEISSMIPSDCQKLKYSFKNVEEQRVDLNKQVGKFEGNAFYGMNGGSVSFDLSVNNIFVGRFTIIVERKANGININGDELVFVSAPSYSIVANALPSDTHQTKLGFRSENEKIAKVNADGSVEFYSLGKVVITIYVIDNPSVFKQIEIEYTKELQSISFSQSKTKMYVGEFVDFNIISNPIIVNDFEIKIVLSDPSIADITIINGVYRLIGKSGGKVVVTAKVVGKDISFSKEFTFYPKITDIQLELDKVDDNVGLGQYRYFGTKFVQNNKIINTFQMKFTLLPSNDFANLLEWSSSNPEIATVDGNGVVTVLKAGNVTITVKQIAPYENAATAIDSYEFNFVEGINIYGNDDFIYVYGNRSTLKPKSLVLQKDILNYDKTIAVTFNIHGNGHIFDFSKSGQNAIYIAQSNVVLDNLTIRKITFEGGFALSDLEKVGNLVVVYKKAENVTIYNCIIENATAGIQVLDAKIKTAGCIFRNTYFAGIKLTKADNNPNPPEVVVEDCIFAHSLLAGILYDVDSKRNTTMEPAKVTLIGEVRFYCWKTFDELEQGFSNALKNVLGSFDLSGAFTDIINQVENIFSKYNDYKYIYNNKEYFNISIVSFNINFAGKQIDSGTITLDKSKLNASCNYENVNCEGTITIAGLANSNFNFQILTLPSKYPFIKPSDTYIGNQYVLSLIRQPKLY